jgi:hypothetical protein
VSHNSMIENLESRVLLSASSLVFNPTIKADRLVVRADLLKFRSDIFLTQAKLLADTQAIKHNVAKGDTSLVAPFATLHADVKAMRLALRGDRLAESVVTLGDELQIKLDQLQILKDRGNATALAADHAKLVTDRIKLQNDIVAGLDTRIATRQAELPTISADVDGIVTAANNDPNASADLKAAASKFGDDRTARLATLTADLQAIEAARAQLVADMTAAQNA